MREKTLKKVLYDCVSGSVIIKGPSVLFPFGETVFSGREYIRKRRFCTPPSDQQKLSSGNGGGFFIYSEAYAANQESYTDT